MKHKTRWLWLVLAACLLITQIPAIAADTPSELKIELRRVEGERAVEVSLLVTAGERFTQAEAVLEYDPGYVKPAGTTVDTAVDWSTAVTAQTTAPGQVSGKPSLVYETAADGADTETPAAAKGYLYLGAELMRGAQPSAETRLVTVRFELTDAAAAAAEGEEDAGYLKAWFKLASQDACTGSPVGCAAQVIAGAAYNYVPEGTEQPLYTQPLALPAWTTLTGPSLSGGGAASTPSTDGFCSVVFYDWDGTLLGTRLVAKHGSISAEDQPKPGYDNNTGEQLTFTYDADTDGDGMGDTETTYADDRGGYIFAGWVDYYKGSSTPNTDVSASAGQTLPETGDGALVSLDDIQKDLVLKAAYNEDSSTIGAEAFQRRYTLTCSKFRENDTGIETTFTAHRLSNARRANDGSTSLQVVMTPLGSDPMILVLPFSTSDCAEVTLSIPFDAPYLYDPDAAISAVVTNDDGQGISSSVTLSADRLVVE